MTNTLKLHKIRNVDLAVCSAEQKVAYNLTFAHYNTNTAHKFTPEEFAEWCMKLYHPDSKTAEKYSREAIKKAIENGYMNYLGKPFIASDYEKIGKAFPVEPVPEYETTPEGNQTAEQPEEQAKPGNGKPKTCKRPKGEKSHCIMSASSLKALETMINSYYFSKSYIITEDMAVYNTATEKTIDSVYVKFTPAGRYQCRKIDVFGESKEPEKAEQKHDSEFSGSLLDGQLENHLEESRKEESAPTEAKGESTMKENTNAAAQAQEAQATEKKYTVEQVRQITGLNSESVRITAHTFPDYDGGTYQAFRAAFVAGTAYKIPEKYVKSAAAEIIFTVVSNSGKSLKVNIYEKYNGKISEQINKTKKLCPGGHGHWLVFDTVSKKFMHEWRTDEKQNTIEFFQVDTIESGNISRWTNGYISCYECIPMTETEFDNWRQNPGTATTNSAQPGRKTAEELDFTPIFYPVSEELARQHKNMISWSDYKPGTATAEYQEAVKHAYELARVSSDPEKSLYLADCYSRRLARWYDDYNRNGAACPSIMICGGSNFPTRKKEKQNARFDTLMHQYDKIKHLLEKIRKPHGYGVEIRRDTITAEEFDSILYFETIINEEENRLQLVFDGKPEEEERNILKKNGFRWSPRFKAWQRQLTENAVAAVWNIVKQFDELEDSENAEIQKETEKIKSATPENERTETVESPVETAEAEQEAQPEEIPEESAQAETIPTEADTSPTDSPEPVNPETIPPQAETPTEAPQTAETSTAGETEAVDDWSGVKFEPIPGIPDPETVGAYTAERADKLTEALEKLDRMRHKLDKSTYTNTGNSRYYAGFLSAVCCIFGEILYDAETGKHYLQIVSENTQADPEAEENSVETAQTAETVTEPEQAADETIKFEPGKIYSAIHITNSDYISAYKVISRTAKTIILENSSGEQVRKRPTITDRYINGKQCRCETVYPDGVYSMCLVLDATNKVNADTPKQAEQDYFRQQQERTATAVSAARQRQIIQTTGGKITMTIGAAQ